jgi:predicted Zn-dependent protease
MKQVIFGLIAVSLCTPAYAQFGGALSKLQKAQEAKQALDELNVSEDEERAIGADVSEKIRARFGVVQDQAVHKYVTLVGTLVAQQSERPTLAWTFIVLDTDGVNAFASPGGFVHVTRGALGLIRNEAELAGVLAHEIGHVAHKHTVNAIRKNKAVQLGTSETLKDRGPLLDQIANRAYEMVLENAFDRNDELDADRAAVQYVGKLGYAPRALGDFLQRLDDRNRDQAERNGLFASHPETKERIGKIAQLAGASKGTALGAARYTSTIQYEPTPLASIAVIEDGAAGLAGGGDTKAEAKAEPKKDAAAKPRGLGLGSLSAVVGKEQQSQQVAASGGARGIGADRAAKGGSNPAIVRVAVAAAELAAFKQGIA